MEQKKSLYAMYIFMFISTKKNSDKDVRQPKFLQTLVQTLTQNLV